MNTNSAKYLLYLDTRDLPAERDGQILAAVQAGFSLIVATDHPEKYRFHQVAHIIATRLGDFDLAQREIVAFLDAKGIRPEGVLFWKDREVELGARLAEQFRLPGNSTAGSRQVRDKAAMRAQLQPLGVNAKYAVVTNRTEFAAALRTVGVPALLKPAGNSGSRGIVRVTSAGDHTAYEEFCQYNRRATGDMYSYYADHALLEEELTGSEHSAAGFVCGGEVYVAAIADKRFEREIFMQYENIVPSLLVPEIQNAVTDAVIRAARALGLACGGFHADIIVSPQGKPYILELGGRLGGEMINSHLIPLAYGGFSPYDELIRILSGGAPSLAPDQYRRSAMQAGARIVRAPHTGRIRQIHGLEALTKHPAVRLITQMKGPEGAIYKPRDKFKEYEVVYLIAQCGHDQDMHELLDSLEALLRIEMYAEAPVARSVNAD